MGADVIDDVIRFLGSNWGSTKDFLNSVFFISIASAFAGAFAGASIAQKIAERSKRRDELTKEIRNTNAAVVVASAVTEVFMSLKTQHVQGLKDNFEKTEANFRQFVARRNTGQIGREVEFQLVVDFRSLAIPPMPLDVLQQQMFEKLSLSGRPPRLQIALAQSAHSVADFVQKRNELIQSFKASNHPREKLLKLYFGLPDSDGHINQEYASSLSAIYKFTDDGIYFGVMLCDDLALHALELSQRFFKEFGESGPPPASVDFSNARTTGIIPDAAEYSDWSTGFIKKLPLKYCLWQRISRFLSAT